MIAAAIGVTLAWGALADGKLSGAMDCDKAEPAYSIPVPDGQGQVYVLEQHRCRWTKPWTIAGVQPTENVNVTFIEVTPSGVNIINTSVTHYSNGDRTFVRSVGKVGSRQGDLWTYLGGTGKLEGIQGHGFSRCKGKSTEPGSGYVCELTGSYRLAPRKA
jgi:hypothetical protein